MAAEYTASASQAVAVGANVLYTATAVYPDTCAIRHREGSGVVTLKGRGSYRVSFNGNVSVAAATSVAQLAIALDGEALPSGTMISTSTASGDAHNVSATVIIEVPCCCCYKVSVQNNGTLAATVQNANLTISKIS